MVLAQIIESFDAETQKLAEESTGGDLLKLKVSKIFLGINGKDADAELQKRLEELEKEQEEGEEAL